MDIQDPSQIALRSTFDEQMNDREAICEGLSIFFPIAIYLKCVSILINRYRKGDPKGRKRSLAQALPSPTINLLTIAQFGSNGQTFMASIFITGATGFLGKEIVRQLLAAGHTVRALSRTQQGSENPNLRWIRGSLTELPALEQGCLGAHAIIHTAALTGLWGPYKAFFRANILGTQHLLVAAKVARVPHFIYTSSPSVVYNGTAIQDGDEFLPYVDLKQKAPPYVFTKAYAEFLVLRAQQQGSFHAVALRPHLIWGPQEPHMLPRLLSRAQAGRLRQIGPGDNHVSMTHVSNAARAHLDALDALQKGYSGGEAFFINDQEPVALWPWITQKVEAAGFSLQPKPLSLKAAVAWGAFFEAITPSFIEPPMTRFLAHQLALDHTFSITKAKSLLGYAPKAHD